MKFLTTFDRLTEILAIMLYEHSSSATDGLPWGLIGDKARDSWRKVARGEVEF